MTVLAVDGLQKSFGGVQAVAAMAIGVMFKRPCLRGSCGGPAVTAHDGTRLSCTTCPNRKRTPAPPPQAAD